MSQHTGSHKNSLNYICENYLNESHWPMCRIRLLECIGTESMLLSFHKNEVVLFPDCLGTFVLFLQQ